MSHREQDYLRTTASYIGPSKLKLMPPNSRRTLMPCKTGTVPGRCHLIKCEVLRITNKRNKIMANYYIHGQQLQIVDNAKYLGLTISKNLSWNNHVNNITKKANSTLALLRRNIRNCPQRAKTQAYNTFVRPPLLCEIHILRPTSIK